MRKIWKACTAFCLLFSVLCMQACSGSSSTVEIQEGVEFALMDVLKVTNETSNTIFYYFLASVENNSDQDYHMSNLDYSISVASNNQSITPIDKYQSTITTTIAPGLSTFVYGYIGYPNSSQENVGLYFPKQDAFVSFDSVSVRTINDENIYNSDQAAFTVYDDEYFSFEVDAENLTYDYSEGVSTVSGLTITYTNKTDQRLVVPFLTPICTIDGLDLSSYSNKEELMKMTLAQIKKQDFKENGLAPKTKSYTGSALGYQLYYLGPEQSVPCSVSFSFEGIIPDFSSQSVKGAIRININSPALGYSQILKVSY